MSVVTRLTDRCVAAVAMQRRARFFLVLAAIGTVLVFGIVGGPVRADDPSDAPKAVNPDTIPLETVKAIKGATVFIKADTAETKSSGSGFLIQVIGETGYVVTNVHVILPHEII